MQNVFAAVMKPGLRNHMERVHEPAIILVINRR